MRNFMLAIACAATTAALLLVSASATPGTQASATKRCRALAAKLVKRTLHYPSGLRRGANASSTPICFDFTGDGRSDVAFGIESGGTAGPTYWAVFRAVSSSSKRPSVRYAKVAERFSGSKTRLLRRGRRLAVQTPIYRREDGNCCPTGGAWRVLYRVEKSRVVRVGAQRLNPREAGQTG